MHSIRSPQHISLKEMARCNGTTKTGNRCSITATSTLTNDRGRLVCEPLRRGSDFCLLHSKPFLSKPAPTNETEAIVLLILDLESTGVDISQDRICELAATHAPSNPSVFGGSFSTVVCVDADILRERGSEAAEVHGISEEETAAGPCFADAWRRFLGWTEQLLNNAVREGENSSDDEQDPRLIEEPILVLAAHNGIESSFKVRLSFLTSPPSFALS